ncbi:MAG: type I restriction enzyme endonuclease domain-containing protein [Metallibacterium sp.]
MAAATDPLATSLLRFLPADGGSLGNEALRRLLCERLGRVVTIDWTRRETVCANLRVLVKRILRQYGYPPDKQEKATQTVLEQAEQLSGLWAAATP